MLETNASSYSVGGQRFELGLTGLKSRSAGLRSFWGLRGKSASLPFPAVGAACIPGLVTPAPVSKAGGTASSTLSDSPASLLEGPEITRGPAGQSGKLSPS